MKHVGTHKLGPSIALALLVTTVKSVMDLGALNALLTIHPLLALFLALTMDQFQEVTA